MARKMSYESSLAISFLLVSVATAGLQLTSSETVAQQLSPVVKTKTGPIRGRLVQVTPQLYVYEFLAIPFAEPPTGQRRFRKPEPKSPWKETLDATKLPNSCTQLALMGGVPKDFLGATRMAPKGVSSEDCLYLNLWVPKLVLDAVLATNKEAKLVGVFTFIHGGGFSSGATSVDLYNGALMAAYNNLIVTTVQYRLGSLGFAYYGNEEAPGNMGLWDQLEAMKWIYENVAYFGGNFDEITIGGQSAGAISVTAHLLSPYSRKYFKKAIVESGTALWGVHSPELAKKMTDMVYREIGSKQCNQTGQVNMQAPVADKLTCLRSANGALFPIGDLYPIAMGFGMPFGPVVDGDFIPMDPLKMMKAGQFYKAPLLIGANKDEGSLFLLLSIEATSYLPAPGSADRSLFGLNHTSFDTMLAGVSHILSAASQLPVDPLLSKAVRLHYWPATHDGFPVGDEIARAAVQALGDHIVTCPTYSWAELAALQGTTVFSYYFTQRSHASPWPKWMGVMHNDEMPFIFGEPLAEYAKAYDYSSNDKILSRVMMAQWTNFIKYGDPNIRDVATFNIMNGASYSGPLQQRPWPPYSGKGDCKQQTVEINDVTQVFNFGESVYCGVKARECQFWNDYFPELVGRVKPASY